MDPITLGIIVGGQFGYMLCESVFKIDKDIIIYVYSDKEDIPCNLFKSDITILYFWIKINFFLLKTITKRCLQFLFF